MKKLLIIILAITTGLSVYAQTMLTDVNKADELYKDDKFAESLFIYNSIDNPDGRISKRIEEIQKKLSDETFANDQFQKCILDGNNANKNQNYELAYICFNAALLIKPDANFPKTKLRDLSQFITDPNVDKRFDNLIATADKYYESQNYEMAKKTYKDALVIKPGDAHSSNRIVEIDDIMVKKNASQKEYDDNIFYADRFMANNDLEQAKVYYQKALELQPNEAYPKDKLNEILKTQTDAAQLETSYLTAINKGDSAFTQHAYDTAKEFFSEALTYKPTEEYPRTMINKINNAIDTQNAKANEIATIRTNISETIAAKQFVTAQSHIQKGLALLPQDSLFLSQKAMVDSILTQRQIDDMNFDNFVDMAKDAYASKDYENASRYYSMALDIKPDENVASKKHRADSLYQLKLDREATKLAAADKKAETQKNNEKTKTVQDNSKDKPQEISAANEEQKKAANETKGTDQQPATEQKTQNKTADADRKPHEEPQNKISPTNQSDAYTKLLNESQLSYSKGQYDKALAGYASILKTYKDDPTAQQSINEITTLLNNNVVRQLVTAPVTITAGSKQNFDFEKLLPKDRKNNYLKIIIKSTDDKTPKIYVNLYKFNAKKSGFLLKDVNANAGNEALYISLSVIPSWMREDISRIEIVTENGDVNIVEMSIIAVP